MGLPMTDGAADVPESDWFFKEGWIQWILENGIMDLDDAGNFRPDDPVTRGEAALALWRGSMPAEDDPSWDASTPFSDVPGLTELATAVNWCDAFQIMFPADDGTVGTSAFSADAPMTAQSLALVLARYAEAFWCADVSETPDERPLDEVDMSGFCDGAEVDGWARDAVRWCVARGVMTGQPGADGLLHLEARAECPRSYAARRLAVVMRGTSDAPNPYAYT